MMRLATCAAFVLLLAAAVTSVVRGAHSPVPLEFTMRLRVFDPKYDSAKHGKGITLNSTAGFRYGEPFCLMNGGESDLPEFDENLQFGTTIDGDMRLLKDGKAMVNLKLTISQRFTLEKQRDVHQVDGQLLHVCCPVTLGKARLVKCSDGRSLEILVEPSH